MNLRLQPLVGGNATASKAAAPPSASDMVARLHALMLQQAFKTMLQSTTATTSDKSSFARDVWRDQLAEKLAVAATQSGSLTGQRGPED